MSVLVSLSFSSIGPMSLSLCCFSLAYGSTEQRYEPTTTTAAEGESDKGTEGESDKGTEGESDKGTVEEASAIESQENK